MPTSNILFKVTFIITSVYLMTACATQQLPITEKQSIRKIAILSELESQMSLGDINHSIENDLAQKLWSKGIEVVILQTSSAEIMQEKQKMLINQSSYKGATEVIMVKPIYQKEEYPLFRAGYGVFEKNTLGIKQRLLYASIIYEVYSTKDGNRKAYYVAHPEGSEVIKLKKNEADMLKYKPQLYALFDQINTNALKSLGFY